MTSPLEIVANIVMTLSILLAGRNSLHTWWTGIIGCVLFALLFYRAQLYADVTLQVFFIAVSGFGWWHWLHGDTNRAALPIRRAYPRHFAIAVALGAVSALGYGALLHVWTDAYAPFLDSMVLSFSVVAQMLLLQRRLENWPVWVLVNTMAVPLFASRGLYLTSALYAVYWINALVSWRHWHREMLRQSSSAASA